MKSDISTKKANEHLEVILNILHFKTKQNFYTTATWNNREERKNIRRHNKGHSLIDKAIVSVDSFQAEQEVLLSDFKIRDYQVVEQIGKGGFGRVFLVKSPKDNSKVTIIPLNRKLINYHSSWPSKECLTKLQNNKEKIFKKLDFFDIAILTQIFFN